jgi:hypothetical protein
MPPNKSTEDLPVGYWASFGYQNHVIPIGAPPRTDRKLYGLCGILTPAQDVSGKDDRPACAWCAEQVRTGQVQIVCNPDMA